MGSVDKIFVTSIFVTDSSGVSNIDDVTRVLSTNVLNKFNKETYFDVVEPIIPEVEFTSRVTNVFSKINSNLRGVAKVNVFNKNYLSNKKMFTYALVKYKRKNSNIYKNIHPHSVIDYSFVDVLKEQYQDPAIVTINQSKHGLNLYDVVYQTTGGLYKQAIAQNTNKSIVVGVVNKIIDNNNFELITNGFIPFPIDNVEKSGIMYLSDVKAGKITQSISNNVYIPIGLYVDNGIVLNIQQGSYGMDMIPYVDSYYDMEIYSEEEINETIKAVKQGVINNE